MKPPAARSRRPRSKSKPSVEVEAVVLALHHAVDADGEKRPAVHQRDAVVAQRHVRYALRRFPAEERLLREEHAARLGIGDLHVRPVQAGCPRRGRRVGDDVPVAADLRRHVGAVHAHAERGPVERSPRRHRHAQLGGGVRERRGAHEPHARRLEVGHLHPIRARLLREHAQVERIERHGIALQKVGPVESDVDRKARGTVRNAAQVDRAAPFFQTRTQRERLAGDFLSGGVVPDNGAGVGRPAARVVQARLRRDAERERVPRPLHRQRLRFHRESPGGVVGSGCDDLADDAHASARLREHEGVAVDSGLLPDRRVGEHVRAHDDAGQRRVRRVVHAHVFLAPRGHDGEKKQNKDRPCHFRRFT